MSVSSIQLLTRSEARAVLFAVPGIARKEIEAALDHPVGLRFEDKGKSIVLLKRGPDAYEEVEEGPDDRMRAMHAEGITVMRALADEPGEPKGRRIGSTMPIAKSGTVFFSAPTLAPQTTQEIYVGQTLTLPIVAHDFTGDQVTLKADPFPLPAGAAFTDHGDGSGTLTFTPTEPGAWDFVVTASVLQESPWVIRALTEAHPRGSSAPEPEPFL